MIAIVDYGMGNLRSVAKAFEHLGADVIVTNKPEELRKAEKIVLPGVGAFPDGMRNLAPLIPVLTEEVLEKRKPFLGICLGMQMLASTGDEKGQTKGLGWIPGTVQYLDESLSAGLKVPHVGWDDLTMKNSAGTPFVTLENGTDVYFVHSYSFRPEDEKHIAAICNYGTNIVAALHKGNIIATQFHPEKSQEAGLGIVKAFIDWVPEQEVSEEKTC